MHYFITIVVVVVVFLNPLKAGNIIVNRIQHNIRKRNQSFGYGNYIRFIFGLQTSFEMSEGRLNVSFFL